MKRFLLSLLLFASPALADQISNSKFRGLDNNRNSLLIEPEWAQDLLNVDVTPNGSSVKKRPGYGIYKTLTTGKPIRGIFHFYDTTGNDVQIVGSSTSLYGIVADGTPTQLISSATLSSTWDCTDIQANAYCVTSNRDVLIKTNGATQQWFTTPLGTMVESTPDRLVVAGVSASPNTIFISGSNAFTTFTAGPLTTDPFSEVIAAPGSKITHLRWGCQKLLWWKDQSMGYMDFDDQYTASVKIVSDNIGTFDNTSAIDPGGSVWFRGQDGHIYQYDCSGLVKQSIEITPFIQASGKRTSNSWTQTSQSDFQAGSSSPTAPSQPLSFTISVGDVVPSSFNVTENSSASGWGSGTASNTTVGTSSITLTLNNSGNVNDNGFENCTPPLTFSSDWSGVGSWQIRNSNASFGGCSLSPQAGSIFVQSTTSNDLSFKVIDLSGNTVASTPLNSSVCNTACSWSSVSISSAAYTGKRFKVKIVDNTNSWTITSASSYIFGGSISFYCANANGTNIYAIDSVTSGSSTITSGTFTSQALNTGLPYSFVYASATWNVNTSTPSFIIQKSTAPGGRWIELANSTGTNLQTDRQYLRYISTFTVSGSDNNALSSLTGVQLIAVSSGAYYSAWHPAPNLNTWSTFNANWTDNGDDINFAVRVATEASFSVLNSTPAGVAQTNGAQVSASTATYFQLIATFTVTAATNTVSSLQSFMFNWFDGSATDQAYMLYFDNAIWASVAYGVGVSSNTYIFKRDLVNDAFTVYNIGTGGMIIQNNRLYFGDTSTSANIFIYGSGTSDNSNPITAYWRTKTFAGQDPFLENNYTNLDSYWARNANQTGTVSYTLNGSTSTTSYTVSLSSTTQSIIRSKKNLPTGTNGSTIDLKFGDTSSSSQWELFLYRLMYAVYPYKPG